MRIPQSTYRLQLHPGFGFEQAESILGYLRDLGISDIYASPIFEAVAGSGHGYDIVRPERVSPELGGEAALQRLMEAVHSRNLGWLQDIVPNHMAFASGNDRLMDLLRHGPSSSYRRFFDIDWEHPHPAWRGKLLAPFLGRRFQECLEDAELLLGLDDSGLHLRFYEIRLPLCPEAALRIVQQALEEMGRNHSASNEEYLEAGRLCTRLENALGSEVPQSGDSDRMAAAIWALSEQQGPFREALEAVLERINASPEALTSIASEQHYQLAFWRTATQEINYRRFFSINNLICLRMEDEEVFDDLHRFVLELAGKWGVTGLRIDHLDGLLDPAAYLSRLREKLPDAYIVAEKILEPEERLPLGWPVQGTTGYDFLFYVNNLFCQADNEPPFDDLYRGLSDTERIQGPEGTAESKRSILRNEMAGDLDNLVHSFLSLIAELPCGRDLPFHRLRQALEEVLVRFPVYRSYVSQESVEAADPSYLRQGLRRAETGAPHLQPELDCLSRMIGAALQVDGEAFSRRARQCVQRLQQLSGPLMAKGFEDTYLYRNARLVSLNEVGGHPDRFGISLGAFHAFLKERALHWSSSLNASATHDTKRGEDVRARLNALSELPEDWARAVRRFAEINRPAKATLRGRPAPDGADEYFLYQTLIGAWPLDPSHYAELRGRIRDYTVKAVREAKLHSSWLDPDPAYEEACLDFIERLLPETGHNAFLETFLPLQRRIAHYGMINSLAQTAIKLTAPGLPDIYQGCELWDLSLVDPDNRRPVDFALRSRLLAGIRDAFARDPEQLLRDLLAHPKDGRVKLHLVHRALQLRQKRQALFAHGEYLPVQCRGMHRDRLVAFARRNGGQWSLTLVPRFTAPLLEQGRFPMGPDFWHDTSLVLPREAPRAWSSSLDGRRIELQDRELAVGQALEHFPVGILESAG